jgi:DsbC/DsbD-like thiol-disulfide interchange protein
MIPTVLCSIALVALAPGQPQPKAKAQHVQARLLCEKESLVAGETTWFGVEFTIERGWHMYWNGVNDSGMPPTLQVTAPPKFAPGEVVWPAPTRHIGAGDVLDHIYEGKVMLLFPVYVPKEPGVATATIDVQSKWLVCSTMCLPEEGIQSLTLPVASPGSQAKASSQAAAFAQTRARVPVPLASGTAARLEGLTLVIESPGASKLTFYPADGCAPMPHLLKEGESQGPKLTIQFKPESQPARVKGVIQVDAKDKKEPSFYSVDLEVPGAAPTQPANAPENTPLTHPAPK